MSGIDVRGWPEEGEKQEAEESVTLWVAPDTSKEKPISTSEFRVAIRSVVESDDGYEIVDHRDCLARLSVPAVHEDAVRERLQKEGVYIWGH